MRKLQSQGVHHITITGADRQTSIDFWEGVLGMPFVFEQPNLDNPSESHLYFDPGDGRLITIFTNEDREADPTRTPTDPGCVHHLAFSLSQATFQQAVERLDEREISHSGVKDRGFMDSIYFEDPLGLLIELASYRFEPPHGHTHADVLLEAHRIRVQRGDYNIAQEHLADAIEALAEAIASVALGRQVAEGPLRLGRAARRHHDVAPGDAEPLRVLVGRLEDRQRALAQRVGLAAGLQDFAAGDREGMVGELGFQKVARRPGGERELLLVRGDLEPVRPEELRNRIVVVPRKPRGARGSPERFGDRLAQEAHHVGERAPGIRH